MFEEFLLQKLNEESVVWEAQANALIESKYLGDAKQWADRRVRGDNGPPPVIPFAVDFEVAGFGIVAKANTTLVSRISAESFLPTYRTDQKAIGGPVGGPIEGSSDRFYAVSTANPQAGDVHVSSSGTFVYQRPNPFGGYWRKL